MPSTRPRCCQFGCDWYVIFFRAKDGLLWKPLAMDWNWVGIWSWNHHGLLWKQHGLLWKRPWDQWELRWTEWTGEEYGNIIFSQLELDVKRWISGCKLQLKISKDRTHGYLWYFPIEDLVFCGLNWSRKTGLLHIPNICWWIGLRTSNASIRFAGLFVVRLFVVGQISYQLGQCWFD